MRRRTPLGILLLVGIVLTCVACGPSGAEGPPKAMRGAEDHLQRCPDNVARRPKNENPLAKRTLVPPGARGALICRYQGRRTAGPPPTPQASALHVGSRGLKRLLRAFEQLKPVRRGAVACPVGRLLRYFVALHYRGQSDDFVRVDFNGCGLVTNDALEMRFYPDEELHRLLRRLAPIWRRDSGVGRTRSATASSRGLVSWRP
jgi:hypothetical protein